MKAGKILSDPQIGMVSSRPTRTILGRALHLTVETGALTGAPAPCSNTILPYQANSDFLYTLPRPMGFPPRRLLLHGICIHYGKNLRELFNGYPQQPCLYLRPAGRAPVYRWFRFNTVSQWAILQDRTDS